MRCSFVCHLVEDVVTDDQSVTAVVTSEVGHVSYIGDTGDGFLGCLNTACGDPAGFVYGIYLTVQCWSKLSGGVLGYAPLLTRFITTDATASWPS